MPSRRATAAMLIRNQAAFAALRSGSFFRLRARSWTLVLLELLERGAASGRNEPAVGHQAMGDALAIRNKLSTINLRIRHAGVLILLLVCSCRPRRQ